MGNASINALVLDYGGVISKPQNPQNVKRMLDRVNQNYDDFMRVYTDRRVQFDSGDVSSDDYWTGLLEQYGIEPTASTIAWLNQEDIESWTQVNALMIDFIRQNRSRIPKLAMISNMTQDTLVFMRRHFQWLDLFDHLTFSCQLGTTKPDRAIYESCLNALAIPAQECLFVDDSLTNVKGAIDVGMAAVHFQNYDQFMAELAKIGFFNPDAQT